MADVLRQLHFAAEVRRAQVPVLRLAVFACGFLSRVAASSAIMHGLPVVDAIWFVRIPYAVHREEVGPLLL